MVANNTSRYSGDEIHEMIKKFNSMLSMAIDIIGKDHLFKYGSRVILVDYLSGNLPDIFKHIAPQDKGPIMAKIAFFSEYEKDIALKNKLLMLSDSLSL